MYISGFKFQDHCSNILKIFLIHYFVVLVDIIIQKREYLWNEKRHSEK